MSAFDAKHVDVRHFLETLGIENITKATQQEMRFSCPFPDHAGGDETPSCYMNLNTSAFFCHGCKEKGSAVEFACFVLGLSPIQAVRLLKQAYQPGAINPDARNMVSEVERIFAESQEEIHQPQLDESLLDRYAMDWDAAWEARGSDMAFPPCDYFFDRGFEPSMLKSWEFGWDSRTQRVVFPVRDEDGTLIGFKGRACDDRKPKYLVLGDGPNGGSYGFKRYYPSQVVFGAFRCKQHATGPLIICEGEFNAMHARYKASLQAVAINGSFFQRWHASVIRSIVGDEGAITFLDDDDAGRHCVWGWYNSKGEYQQGIVDLLSPHMPLKIILGQNKDAADMTRAEVIEAIMYAKPHLLAAIERS